MARNYAKLSKLDELKALVDKLYEAGKPIGFDVETGYLGPEREKASLDWSCPSQFVSGFSISNDPRWARYVPVVHDVGPNLPEEQAWETVKPLLEELPVVAHNWKFEAHNLAMLDVKSRGPKIDLSFGGDSMLDGYVIQSVKLPKPHDHSEGSKGEPRAEFRAWNLKDMVFAAFGHEQPKISTLFPGWSSARLKKLRFNILELTPEVVNYACEDASWCLALHYLIEPQARAERGFILGVENEICQLMFELEQFGMNVAWNEMEAERQHAIPFQARMEKAVKTGLGILAERDLSTMNLGSTKQLKELIYRDLGFSTTRLTGTAAKQLAKGKERWEVMSTDAVAMEGLSKEHPALKKLLEWREVGNALNRFDKWLDEHHFSYDDRIHPSFSQVMVGTGRFAANDPPVQQMPKEWRWSTRQDIDVWNSSEWATFVAREDTKNYEDYWAGNFRDYVCAPDGWYQLGFDYSQIELRIMAGVSEEPLLLEAFANGDDVHTLTAAMMLDKAIEDVDRKVDRPVGKTMNFALLYQMGPQSLSERLGITRERANHLYQRYFDQFSSITSWMQRQRAKEIHGYAETPFGRKYTVREFESDNKAVYAKGQRVMINAPIQGGAADYMKLAMIRCRRALVKAGLWGTKVKMIHNLHDALVFEVHNSVHPQELRDLLNEQVILPESVTQRFGLNLPPIVADWELGQRHGSCDEWKPEKGHYPAWDEETGTWQIRTSPEGSVREEPRKERPPELSPTPEGTAEPEKPTQEPEKPEPKNDPPSLKLVQATQKPVDLLCEVKEMPTLSQVQRLIDFLAKRPGQNTLVLVTPEGRVRCSSETDINVTDGGLLSVILGGATLRHAEDTVDLDALASDIQL